jgi:hypothetical protein
MWNRLSLIWFLWFDCQRFDVLDVVMLLVDGADRSGARSRNIIGLDFHRIEVGGVGRHRRGCPGDAVAAPALAPPKGEEDRHKPGM